MMMVGKVKTGMTGWGPENDDEVKEGAQTVYSLLVSQLWRDKLDHYRNFSSPLLLYLTVETVK